MQYFLYRELCERRYLTVIGRKKTDFHPKTRDLFLPVLTENDMRMYLHTVGYSSSSIVFE